VREARRDREGLEDGRGLVDRTVAELRLEGRERGRRNAVDDVDLTREQVGVGGILRRVEDDVQACVVRCTAALVVVVLHERDLHVVLPRVVRGDLVRAVADRVLPNASMSSNAESGSG
jgi:hypothetical protein